MSEQITFRRRALVTGVTGTIGMVLAASLSQAGYRVVGIHSGRNPEKAAALELNFGVSCRQLDLTDSHSIASLDRDYDILVNNAGVNLTSALVADVSLEAWADTLSVNLTAPFLLSRRILPHMISRRWGRIINISSIYGLRGSEANSPYNASKHGLSGLTKSIAKDYADTGITCNEVCPGPVNSEMLTGIAASEAAEFGGTTSERLESYAQEIPARRLASAEDLVGAVLLLASEGGGYINGTSIVVDGGWIA